MNFLLIVKYPFFQNENHYANPKLVMCVGYGIGVTPHSSCSCSLGLSTLPELLGILNLMKMTQCLPGRLER